MRQQDVHTIKPLSRGLPKTGQETSYAVGDDGALEAGWWLGRLNENNRTRFVEKEPVVDEKVVIDLATGLIWPQDWNSAAGNNGNLCKWPTALTVAAAATYAGFTDWHLCNLLEFLSLMNLDHNNPCFHNDIFDNYDITQSYWTSSMCSGNSSLAQRAYFTTVVAVGSLGIDQNAKMIVCRSM